jgi:replication factor A1
MAQISVPKRFEKQFRHLLAKGSVYIFSDIAAIDIRSKPYVYHHQKYLLQFKHDTKVHPLHSRGEHIPALSFDFCPFDQLPAKAIDSKPLLGNMSFVYFSSTIILILLFYNTYLVI